MEIPPGAFDLAPLIPVVAILIFGMVKVIRSPIGLALARRLEGGSEGGATEQRLADVEEALDRVSGELAETRERLEFTERLLARPDRLTWRTDEPLGYPEYRGDDERTPEEGVVSGA